jgi:hypothetical protein
MKGNELGCGGWEDLGGGELTESGVTSSDRVQATDLR